MLWGFSTKRVIFVTSSGSVSITPKDVTISIGWRTPATVARAPDRTWKSTMSEKSIRYTWSAPTTTTMSGFSSSMRFIDWKMALAEPRNHSLPRRCWAGTVTT